MRVGASAARGGGAVRQAAGEDLHAEDLPRLPPQLPGRRGVEEVLGEAPRREERELAGPSAERGDLATPLGGQTVGAGAPSAPPHLPAQPRGVQQAVQARRQTDRIAGRHQEALDAVGDQFGAAPAGGGDDRPAAGHGLQRGQPAGLGQRGADVDVERRGELVRPRAVAAEAHAPFNPQTRRAPAQLGRVP